MNSICSGPEGISAKESAHSPPERPGTAPRGAPNNAEFPLTGVIRNPRSHRNKGHTQGLAGHPDILIAEPRSKEALEEALADFAARGIEILAISGGDGTVRDVLTRGAEVFGDRWPTIAILPKGKTNALAIDLGLPARWRLADAMAAAKAGKTTMRQPIVVEDTAGQLRTRLGFIVGAGAFNAAIDAGQVAHKAGAFQGFAVGATVLWGLIQTLVGFGQTPWRRLVPLRVASSGQPVPQSQHGEPDHRFFAAFTTIRNFPIGLSPFPQSAANGAIDYFLVDAPVRRAVAMLPVAASGRDTDALRRLGIQRGSADSFEFIIGDRYVLDGEFYPAGDYRLKAGPKLNFVTP